MGGWKTSCEMEEGQALGGGCSVADGFKLSVLPEERPQENCKTRAGNEAKYDEVWGISGAGAVALLGLVGSTVCLIRNSSVIETQQLNVFGD